jgi:hypothetical protein
VTLSFAGTLDRSTVVDASRCVSDLIANPAIDAAWTSESSCAGMTVGGLMRHLASQPVMIVTILGDRSAADGAETIEVLQHYQRARWVSEDHAGEANRTIRETADQQAAAEGPELIRGLVAKALADLDLVLAEPPDRAFIPWQGWALATDDFLVTRLMEMVVHSDDLAASIGVPSPQFALDTIDPVIRLLSTLAVLRHGQDALIRTLSRPQRAPQSISAF